MILSPVSYFHFKTPVATSRAYRQPSRAPTKTLSWRTSGDDSISPPVLKAHSFWPLARFNAYKLPSLEPMNTRLLTTAAEDLTGPAVLKRQRSAGFSGSDPPAMPRRAGPP